MSSLAAEALLGAFPDAVRTQLREIIEQYPADRDLRALARQAESRGRAEERERVVDGLLEMAWRAEAAARQPLPRQLRFNAWSSAHENLPEVAMAAQLVRSLLTDTHTADDFTETSALLSEHPADWTTWKSVLELRILGGCKQESLRVSLARFGDAHQACGSPERAMATLLHDDGETPRWLDLIVGQAANRPPPIRTTAFQQAFSGTMCAPLRVAGADGLSYVVKGRNPSWGWPNGRMLFNEQLVGHLGQRLSAPVAPVRLLEVDDGFIGTEAACGHLSAGLVHGSRWLDGTLPGPYNWFRYVSREENRVRFARLAVLYGWTRVGDIQFVYCGPRGLVGSVDHSCILDTFESWGPSALVEREAPAPDPRIIGGTLLTPAELESAVAALKNVTDEQIAEAVAAAPLTWGVSLTERIALARFLAARRDRFACADPGTGPGVRDVAALPAPADLKKLTRGRPHAQVAQVTRIAGQPMTEEGLRTLTSQWVPLGRPLCVLSIAADDALKINTTLRNSHGETIALAGYFIKRSGDVITIHCEHIDIVDASTATAVHAGMTLLAVSLLRGLSSHERAALRVDGADAWLSEFHVNRVPNLEVVDALLEMRAQKFNAAPRRG